MAANRRVPRILFLIADTGGGHRSAANAIRAAMDLITPETFPGGRPDALAAIDARQLPFSSQSLRPQTWGADNRPWSADIHDIIQECGLMPLRRTANLYGPTVAHAPRVYAGIYHATNTKAAYAAMSSFTYAMLRQRFPILLRKLKPDVVVSVHPLLTYPVLRVTRRLGIRIPFIAVVTDLVKYHRAWAEPEVDMCSVPTPEARDLNIAFGMPPEKIRVLGMPIHPKFCLHPADRAQTLSALGLRTDLRTVMLIGGGEGVGGIGEAARAIAAARLPVQMIVITGRNSALREALEAEKQDWETPAAILGFVNRIPDLMRASDFIVTKAGPGTIAEALACGLPIVLTGAIPGQEIGNVEYVQRHQVGELAETPESVAQAIERLSQLDASALATLQERAHALSNPRAAFDIAQMILEYVPSPRSVSRWHTVPHASLRRKRPRRFSLRRFNLSHQVQRLLSPQPTLTRLRLIRRRRH